jgi:hypothetical protein
VNASKVADDFLDLLGIDRGKAFPRRAMVLLEGSRADYLVSASGKQGCRSSGAPCREQELKELASKHVEVQVPERGQHLKVSPGLRPPNRTLSGLRLTDRV